MLKIFTRLYDLVLKIISVKGLFFVVTFIMAGWKENPLPALYVFAAGAIWTGSRELYKFMQNKRGRE